MFAADTQAILLLCANFGQNRPTTRYEDC